MRPIRLSSSQRLSRANHSLITFTRNSNHYCQYATEGQQLTITGKNTDKIKRKGKAHRSEEGAAAEPVAIQEAASPRMRNPKTMQILRRMKARACSLHIPGEAGTLT